MLRRLSALLLLSTAALHADTYPRQPGVDAVHYVFRLALSEDHAADIALVQRPYVELLSSLIADAVEAGEVPPCEPDHMAFMISALKTAYLHSVLLGNDVGTDAPSVDELIAFCIGGLHANGV